MTYQVSDYFTLLAYNRAKEIGIELTPELGQAWIEKIEAGEIFWKGPSGQDNSNTIFINHMNRRLRLIVAASGTKIITLNERDFASASAIQQADRMGLVLNLSLASLLLEKIRDRDSDVIEVEETFSRNREAKLTFDGKPIRVIYSEDTGYITQIDDYAGPRVEPMHPAVTRHAAERAVQRYEVELTPELSAEIVRRIVTGENLIDHYQIKSGAMAAITEISEGTPACIIYRPAAGHDAPICILTVTPMTYHEAHGRKFIERREAEHAQARAEKRERHHQRKKTQKKVNTKYHRAARAYDDDDDDLDVLVDRYR